MAANTWRAIRNTARIKWAGVPGEMPAREEFVRSVVLGLFKLTEKEVLGIQHNRKEDFVDVAFRGPVAFEDFLERSKTVDLGQFRVESMERRNHRVVIINMFDMNLPDEAVSRFLERYARVVAGPKYRRDAFGFWTGQRVYEVLLRESDHGFEGYLHPPALCTVEGVRGYVVYSRQPPFCRRCMEVGHTGEDCKRVVCHNCRQRGHIAVECTEPRTCNICGSKGHLMRSCPDRQRTYADAAREGTGQRQRQEPAEEAGEAGEKTGAEPSGAEEPRDAAGPAGAERPTSGPTTANQPAEREKESVSRGGECAPASDSAGPRGGESRIPEEEPWTLEGNADSDEEKPMDEEDGGVKRGAKRKGRAEKAAAGEKPSKAKAGVKPKDWAEEVEEKEEEEAKKVSESEEPSKSLGKLPKVFGLG